jgi:hypothetical protein
MMLVSCVDGPLAGESFQVERCPRVVRCVLTADGRADILNMPGDYPLLDEAVHWYRWDGNAGGHLCVRSGSERGCHTVVHLLHGRGVLHAKVDELESVKTAVAS